MYVARERVFDSFPKPATSGSSAFWGDEPSRDEEPQSVSKVAVILMFGSILSHVSYTIIALYTVLAG